MESTTSRRRYLRVLTVGALPAVAGCSGDTGTTDETEETDDGTTTEEGTSTPDEGMSTPADGQVYGRLAEVTTVGSDVSDGTVGQVAIVVTTEKGTVDLSSVTVQWVDAGGVYTLTSGQFTVEAVQDADGSRDGSSPVLDSEDRARLVFDVSAFESRRGLEAGEEATVTLTTQAGEETQIRLTVPDALAGSDRVTL